MPKAPRKKLQPPTDKIRLNLMLADSAQVYQGKLFLLGAGVAAYFMQPGTTMQVAIGGTIKFPFFEQNREHVLLIELYDANGAAVKVPTPMGAQPFRINARMNVALPPQVKRGSSATMPFAVQFPIGLSSGDYEFRFTVDDVEHDEARLPLNIVPGPNATISPAPAT